MYTDGDAEDLSFNQLKALALLYPKSVTEELTRQHDREVKAMTLNLTQKEKSGTTNNQKVDQTKNITGRDMKQRVNDDWQDLDEICVFEKASEILPPVDVAAETTLKISQRSKKKTSDNESSSDEDWLAEVATGLLMSSKSLKPQRKKISPQESNLKRDEVLKNVSLADIKQGERHGCKVINTTKIMENGKYIVGEVSKVRINENFSMFLGNEKRLHCKLYFR